MRTLHRRVLGALPVLLAGLALLGSGHGPAAAQPPSWQPRGAYAGLQFTSLVSPAGYPCIVAFTALQNGGLRVSTDCGVQYATLLLTNAYEVTARDELTGWVAAGSQGIVKTKDQGGSWFSVNQGLPGTLDARSILIHPATLDTVYCGFYGQGVYVGAPDGDSLHAWTSLNAGLGDLQVRHLARTRAGSYFLAGCQGGIWRYAGGSWQAVAPGVVANRIVIDSADSMRVYVAAEDGVHKSVDGGQSFSPSSTGLPAAVPVNDVARLTTLPNVLYAGLRGSGVYESRDYGATWNAFGLALPGENDARAVLATVETGDNLVHVFAGTRVDGLYEAQFDYTTQVQNMTWGRLKHTYR